MAQLLDQSPATPHEIELLAERRDRQAPCRKALVDAYMVHAPSMGAVVIERFNIADENVMQLAKGQIRWGEFATRQKDLVESNRIKMVAAGQRIDAEFNARHQQEMAQRAAAAQAFSDAMYQQKLLNQNQQIINNSNRPVTTNCNRFGSSVSCTS